MQTIFLAGLRSQTDGAVAQTNKGSIGIEFDAQTPIEVKGKEGKVVTYVPKRVAMERAKVSGLRPTFAPIESRTCPHSSARLIRSLAQVIARGRSALSVTGTPVRRNRVL